MAKTKSFHNDRVIPMDDCPIKGCTGVVVSISGNKFYCSQGHRAFYENGKIRIPTPPKPLNKSGYHRSA